MNKRILAIDFGSKFLRIHLPDREIDYITEPSVLAVNRDGKVLAFGEEALHISRTVPGGTSLVYPLYCSSVPEPRYMEAILSYVVKNCDAKGSDLYFSYAGKRDDETERIVVEAAQKAGIRDAFAVDAVYAAALGCQVRGASESAIINIGAGICDMMVFMYSKAVAGKRSIHAGDLFTKAIISHAAKKRRLRLTKEDAERVKATVGSLDPDPDMTVAVTGLRIGLGLPKKAVLTAEEISAAMEPVFDELADDIIALVKNPNCDPDKVILTGGGASLGGIAEALAPLVCMRVEVAEQPEMAVIRGLACLIRQQNDRDRENRQKDNELRAERRAAEKAEREAEKEADRAARKKAAAELREARRQAAIREQKRRLAVEQAEKRQRAAAARNTGRGPAPESRNTMQNGKGVRK